MPRYTKDMDDKLFEKLIAVVGAFFVVIFIIQLIKKINKDTETKIISDRALAALHDPNKKKLFDNAIKQAKKEHEKSGVWVDPYVELN